MNPSETLPLPAGTLSWWSGSSTIGVIPARSPPHLNPDIPFIENSFHILLIYGMLVERLARALLTASVQIVPCPANVVDACHRHPGHATGIDQTPGERN